MIVYIIVVVPEQRHDLLHGLILGSGPDFRQRLVQLERGYFIAEVPIDDLDQRVSVVPAEHKNDASSGRW